MENRLLITGASGFVGGNCLLGLRHTAKITAHSFQNDCPTPVQKAAINCLQADLTKEAQAEALVAKCHPTTVLHTAALASSADCEKNPIHAEQINSAATANLIAACSSLDPLPYLIYTSTDFVFDGAEAPQGGFTEKDPPTPRSCYSRTKLKAESLIRQYQGPFTILRLCLVYGPRVGEKQGFLGWLLERLRNNSAAPVFVDEWRTPISTLDIVDGISLLMQHQFGKQPTSVPKLLHLAGGERLNRHQFAQTVCKHFKLDEGLLQQTFRDPSRAADLSLSSAHFADYLGRSPRRLLQGLQDLS